MWARREKSASVPTLETRGWATRIRLKTDGRRARAGRLGMTVSTTQLKDSETVLRGEDVFGVGFDLDGGEARGVPATAEGFDEEDAGDEFLALQNGEFLFVG